MGVFHHVIVFKALNYPMKDIELVLMHEGTHIVRRDNLGKKLALLIVLVNWFNPILRLYLDDLDAWGDISCDIHVCSHFLGGHARKYFDLLLRFSQEENRSEQLPAFVSQLNSEQSLGKRVEYMIRWQKAGKKTGVSVILALALVIGSSVTAFASSTQVVEQQNDMYRETRVQEADISDADDLEEYVIPADQVDEEKWNNAIVYDDELLDPLSVQKNFDWKIPGNNFVRSGAFIKKAGSTIVVSCYVYDDRYHHVGIRRPDGSMLYVNGMHQVTKTFNCETTGTYYVYVENMRSKEIRAAGYFIK
ncbi:peptidase, M56 family [Eubacterium ramulus ATCC 29099]|uniref:Peptidase, M56 family n=2 Tax=Eubacterium ramulus TaxID=39490 RepID=U2PF41_EUBRA|nr:peptidase, M56 family [Eubacterium ramulus ATCC 29099]